MSTDRTPIETQVARHYGSEGLLEKIGAGLAQLGKSATDVTVDDLGAADEFHIGGRPMTDQLCDRLDIAPSAMVLDVGCGLGGTARRVASRSGCAVTGIDLTAEYVEVASVLSTWTGQQDRVQFVVGSALSMPFADAHFDGAVQLHVGMNIDDKAALFAEIARVLAPGSPFVVYDIMRTGDGDITYPVPWSSDAATSFVASPETYAEALDAAGFELVEQRDHSGFAREFFAAIQARPNDDAGPPPLGLHLVMGPTAPTKIGNMVQGVNSGVLAPTEMLCRKRA